MPARVRRALGIQSGDVLTLDEEDGKLVLKPRLLVEIDWYGDARIAEWEREDQLNETERKRLEAKLK